MASIQKQFDEFHEVIKHDENDERATLREKRDTLLDELRERLPAGTPSFKEFNQGSYAMNTGTVPLDGNFDIDVGLTFDCYREKYPDPVVLKKLVRDALTRVNRTVDIRRPCVTVTYFKNGVAQYHVDLAIYVKRDDNCLDLAMGKENSSEELRFWQASAPRQLTKEIIERHSDQDRAQFRRVVRAMKRWRDNKFSNGGAPLSIALTAAAYHWFVPAKQLDGRYVDLVALRTLASDLLSKFEWCMHDDELVQRLQVPLPVTPYGDLMVNLTNAHMATFKDRLMKLRDELVAAEEEALPEDACARMQKQFGDDFPVPVKEQTAKAVAPAYISTGTSA